MGDGVTVCVWIYKFMDVKVYPMIPEGAANKVCQASFFLFVEATWLHQILHAQGIAPPFVSCTMSHSFRRNLVGRHATAEVRRSDTCTHTKTWIQAYTQQARIMVRTNNTYLFSQQVLIPLYVGSCDQLFIKVWASFDLYFCTLAVI